TIYFFIVSVVIGAIVTLLIYVSFSVKIVAYQRGPKGLPNSLGQPIKTKADIEDALWWEPSEENAHYIMLYVVSVIVLCCSAAFAVWKLSAGIYGVLWTPYNSNLVPYWNGVVLYRWGLFALFGALTVIIKPFYSFKKGNYPKRPGRL